MKKILTCIFIVVAICLLLTIIILFNETKKDDNKAKSINEAFYNSAYITSCSNGYIHFVHGGNEYVSKGQLQNEYTGPADIEIKDGKIKKIYAIRTKKTSTSTSSDALKENQNNDNNISDNSNINSNDEVIKVLLKNKNSIIYKNIEIKSESELFTDEGKIGNKFKASEYFLDKKRKSVVLKSKKEMKFNKKTYEGNFKIIKVKNGYVIVNVIPIETYVKYVIPSEMPLKFKNEALKTQAVCARTFAYMNLGNKKYKKYDADIDDSTSFQVYNSCGRNPKTDKAVEETSNKIITYKNKLINCYYFSTSSGNTEDLSIWGCKSPEYIKSVKSKDNNSPYYRWTAKINTKSIVNADYGKLENIKIIKKSKYGYVTQIKAIYERGSIVYKDENKIRKFIGTGLEEILLYNRQHRTDMSSIPSSCFDVSTKEGDYIVINGAGFGHGIGLSQYGANKLAQAGKNYSEIIRYYYKDVEISDISRIY